MNKELEALRTIGNIRVKETYSDEPSKVSDLKTLFKNQYLLIKQALTPPTEEEVCKALSEYLGEEIIYIDSDIYGNSLFPYTYKMENVVYNKRGLLIFYDKLPPHLITLIGRFYEGDELDEWNNKKVWI